MATEVSVKQNIKIIEESIPVNLVERKIAWEKSLEGMPVFTVKEIEDHKIESGKKWWDNEKYKCERLAI